MATIHNPHLREALRETVGLHCVKFAPLAADNNWFLTATNFGGAANESDTVLAAALTKAYCPDRPVAPVIVVTDAAGDDWTAVSCTIKGIDQFGAEITETAAGTNSSGTWTASFGNAFAYLRTVTIAVTGTTTASDSYIIGFAKTWGIGCKIDASGDLITSNFDGAADAGTTSVVYHTYTPAGTPNAAKYLSLVAIPQSLRA